MKTTRYGALAGFLLATGALAAQVQSTFDSDTENWYVEGDGDVTWSAVQGLPPGALQINDDATGDINIVVAPPKFLGDWSMAGPGDSLACDHRWDRFSGTLLDPRPFKFEISGPGGRARALLDLVPQPELAWAHRAVALEEGSWTMLSGTWDALLANVTQLRVMGEYVDGDEVNHLDNVRLDITPVPRPVGDFQCTGFETGSFEGWTFEGTNGTVSPGEGHPGTAIRMQDVLGPLSRGLAPSAFWGDWTGMDGTGRIGYDVRIASGTNVLATSGEEVILLSGPGGEARLDVDTSVIRDALGAWSRIEAPLDRSLWTMVSGDWDSLLASVNRVDIRLEFISGSETVYFDNFCLGNPCTAAPGGLTDSVTPAGVLLAWDPQVLQGAIGYRVGGRPLGAGGYAFRKVAEPANAFFVPGSLLLADTVYEWVVQAVCTPDGAVRGPLAMDSFRTPAPALARESAEPATLAPNPSPGPLTISVPAWSAMSLHDGLGRTVRAWPAGNGPLHVDLSGLPEGLYWLRHTDPRGREASQALRLVGR